LAEDILEDSFEESLDDIEDVQEESSKKKAIIIIVISFVLLISLALGGWIFFFKGSAKDSQDIQHEIVTPDKNKEKLAREDEVVFEDIVELESFERIELKPGSTMSLISMNLSLELTDHRYRKQVYSMEERIREIITGQVEEMTWLDLRSPEGKIMLKYDLLKRINSIFPKPTIRNIYFTNFIIQ